MIPKVKEWLEKQGYPLEMKVAKELSVNEFATLQSNYYKDSETAKSREIDVVGQIGFENGNNIFIFQLIIECKSNNSKPWIAFSSENHKISDKDFILQRPASRLGDKYLKFIHSNELFQNTKLLSKPKTFAYNVTQAFENDSDTVYSALMSVINATRFRRSKINKGDRYINQCEIYFPMIVLGGKLFDCFIDEHNESQVIEVDTKTLLWKNTLIDHSNTIVEILTFDSFKDRIKGLKEEISELITKKSNLFLEQM